MKAAIILNGITLILLCALTALAFWQAHAQSEIVEQLQSVAQGYSHDTYVVKIGYQNAIVMLVPTLLLLVGFALQVASYMRAGK